MHLHNTYIIQQESNKLDNNILALMEGKQESHKRNSYITDAVKKNDSKECYWYVQIMLSPTNGTTTFMQLLCRTQHYIVQSNVTHIKQFNKNKWTNLLLVIHSPKPDPFPCCNDAALNCTYCPNNFF